MELILYHMPFCPFCVRVFRVLDELDMSIPMKNIQESSEAKEELLRIGGKTQVPCLLIDGKPLYESGDIIAFLRTL